MASDDPSIEPYDEPPRRNDRSIWYIVGGLVVLWVGYLALYGPHEPSGSMAAPVLSPVAATRADFSWTLQTVDGSPLTLDQYRGRPILLNIWASWCGPCVREMPSLDRLAANPRLKDVAFLAVSFENLMDVQRFASDWETKLTILNSPDLPPPMFLTDAIPATFVIAPDGKIVGMQLGAANWDSPSVVDLLEELAAKAAPPASDTSDTLALGDHDPAVTP